jgi:hypothetical protein
MSYLNIKQSFSQIKGSSTGIALKEKGDCMVRALAATADISYNMSHRFCKKFFDRKDNTGTSNAMIMVTMLKAQEESLDIFGRKYDVTVLGKSDLTNRYKVKGEIVYRKKTLKSFIESHPKGSFIVGVAGHALSVVSGELMDWNTLKFKPTRKVLDAYKLERKHLGTQLSLFK